MKITICIDVIGQTLVPLSSVDTHASEVLINFVLLIKILNEYLGVNLGKLDRMTEIEIQEITGLDVQ